MSDKSALTAEQIEHCREMFISGNEDPSDLYIAEVNALCDLAASALAQPDAQAQQLEEAASICERMRPHGGRAWTEGQAACFAALTDAAESIRALAPAIQQGKETK